MKAATGLKPACKQMIVSAPINDVVARI